MHGLCSREDPTEYEQHTLATSVSDTHPYSSDQLWQNTESCLCHSDCLRHIPAYWTADELYGPVLVCVLLFAAVLANFIIRIKSHNGKMKPPKSPWLATYMSYFLEMQDPSNDTINYNDYI